MQRIGKPGFAGADDFVLTLFGWFQPLFANIYVGLAERARDLAIERVKKKTSVAMSRSMAHHPEVQHIDCPHFLRTGGDDPAGGAYCGRLDKQSGSRPFMARQASRGETSLC